MTRMETSARACLTVFLFFLAGNVLIHLPVLQTAEFRMDDLHLSRVYTAAELKSSLVGHWDPDLRETPGYRPLALLLFHSGAVLFGESVRSHRLAQLTILALALTTATALLVALGLPLTAAVVVGILCSITPNILSVAIWTTCLPHAVTMLLLFLAAYLFVRFCDRPPTKRAKWACAGLICLAAALLTREEAIGPSLFLGLLPALLLMIRGKSIGASVRETWAIPVTIALMLVAYAAVRTWAIGFAGPPVLTPINAYRGWVNSFFSMIPSSRAQEGLAALLVAAAICRLTRNEWKYAGIAVLAVVLSSLHCWVICRDTGAFVLVWLFPLLFVIAARLVVRENAAAMGVVLCLFAWKVSEGVTVLQQDLISWHPYSLSTVRFNVRELQGGGKIPEARRAAVTERLRHAGFNNLQNLVQDYNVLYERCQNTWRVGPVYCVPSVRLLE